MLTILSQESNYSVPIFHGGHDMGKLKARVTLLSLLQVSNFRNSSSVGLLKRGQFEITVQIFKNLYLLQNILSAPMHPQVTASQDIVFHM